MQEASPKKKMQKILLSQDPEPLPKITKRKKDLDNSSKSWQLSRTLVTNEMNPTFVSGHILGLQLIRTQNKRNEKAIAVPEREWLDN